MDYLNSFLPNAERPEEPTSTMSTVSTYSTYLCPDGQVLTPKKKSSHMRGSTNVGTAGGLSAHDNAEITRTMQPTDRIADLKKRLNVLQMRAQKKQKDPDSAIAVKLWKEEHLQFYMSVDALTSEAKLSGMKLFGTHGHIPAETIEIIKSLVEFVEGDLAEGYERQKGKDGKAVLHPKENHCDKETDLYYLKRFLEEANDAPGLPKRGSMASVGSERATSPNGNNDSQDSEEDDRLASPQTARKLSALSGVSQGSAAPGGLTIVVNEPEVEETKAVTPKAVTPKAVTPKAVTPKAVTPKAVTPKADDKALKKAAKDAELAAKKQEAEAAAKLKRAARVAEKKVELENAAKQRALQRAETMGLADHEAQTKKNAAKNLRRKQQRKEIPAGLRSKKWRAAWASAYAKAGKEFPGCPKNPSPELVQNEHEVCKAYRFRSQGCVKVVGMQC